MYTSKRINRLCSLLLAVLLTGGLSTCGHRHRAAEDPARPNIIWINVEDIGPALGCYDDPQAITPNLDRLASQGIVYRNAFATAPICAPSRSSFITGVYSTSMGTQHLRSIVERPDFILTLHEHLKNAGYFVTNYGKTDWNFSPDGVFDLWEQSYDPWRKRPENQPFYSMFVIGGTHEGAANRPERYEAITSDLPPELRHDPDGFPVQPAYPDTPEFRAYWARYYDLISAMDIQVGEILQNLEEDGLMDETVVFFFADHGFGAPRHKRYLLTTGLQVPLLVYLPPKYRHWSTTPVGGCEGRLVSLVDLVPSVLEMLGLEVPDYVQGQSFLGPGPDSPREYVYGERSRADDMFEMSRAVLNERYMYVRNYMPYLPYIRNGVIQADDKDGYRGLRRMHYEQALPEPMELLFHPKAVEELYDLQADPGQLNNLADVPELADIRSELSRQLLQWSIDTRDIGFLPEAEYMIRAEGSTPYEIGQDPIAYNLEEVMASADLVGTDRVDAILGYLRAGDAGARYWSVIAINSLPEPGPAVTAALQEVLKDPSPSVQIAAAEALCRLGICTPAIPVLRKLVQDDRPWVALQAARSLVEIGVAAKPLVPVMLEVQKKLLGGPDSPRKYKDFEYASFTGWALETALQQCHAQPL